MVIIDPSIAAYPNLKSRNHEEYTAITEGTKEDVFMKYQNGDIFLGK